MYADRKQSALVGTVVDVVRLGLVGRELVGGSASNWLPCSRACLLMEH